MGIGQNLKSVLKEKRITIKELSKISGVSLNTLYSITKRDSNNADIVKLKKIADALEVPLSVLTAIPNEKGILTFETGKDFEEYKEHFFREMNKNKMKELMNQLNDKGQDKAIDQVEMLTKIDEYKK